MRMINKTAPTSEGVFYALSVSTRNARTINKGPSLIYPADTTSD